jgi:hypothetical protein
MLLLGIWALLLCLASATLDFGSKMGLPQDVVTLKSAGGWTGAGGSCVVVLWRVQLNAIAL